MSRHHTKIRILQVVEELSPAGTETWLLNVLRNIDRDRFAVDFLVHTNQPCAYDADVLALGSTILRCTTPRSPFEYSRRFRALLAANPPYDVIHSHVHHYSGLILHLAAGRIPVRIAHSHTTADANALRARGGAIRKLYLLAMKRAIRQYATTQLAASQDAAAALFGAGWASDPRCALLHCGIALHDIQPAPVSRSLRAALGIPKDSWVIGHVGRFEPAKNHSFILETAAELIRNEPSAHFLLVGDGSGRNQFQSELDRLGLTSRFTLLQERRDVPAILLDAMDCFLFPSLYEGLGLALVEAQAAGLHCLFTGSLPGEATVIPQLCHRLPLGSGAQAWAAALLQLRQLPRMEAAAARSAIEHSPFSIQRSVKRLEEIYGSCA